MLKELFTELYSKLEGEIENDKKSKNGYFEFFVNNILENDAYKKTGFTISPKAVKNYYEKYVEKKENKAGEPKSDLKNIIAKYLDYEDYLDFEKKHQKAKIVVVVNEEVENIKSDNNDIIIKKKKKHKLPLRKIIFVALILLTIPLIYVINTYNTEKKEACIIWNENHFDKANCNLKNTINNSVYNINIENFKKVEVTSETSFFINGNPIIWYGKSSTGKIEFFTGRGVHPETLYELKPTTEYIINKYVFKDKKDKTILE